MDAMTEIRRTFFEECAEQLGELERGLSTLAGGSREGDTVGVVYRAVHSIKGGAASFELKELSRFALMFERVLGEIRAERLEPDAAVHALLGEARTMLGQLVAVARDRDEVFAALARHVPGAEAELLAAAAPSEEPVAEAGEAFDFAGFVPVSVDFGADSGPALYRIDIKPRPELYANANESARLIREVLALGSGHVVCDSSATPLLDALAPEDAFLAWTIELTTGEDESAIREIFDFAEFDCDLDIARLESCEPAPDGMGEDAGDLDADVAALLARLQAGA